MDCCSRRRRYCRCCCVTAGGWVVMASAAAETGAGQCSRRRSVRAGGRCVQSGRVVVEVGWDLCRQRLWDCRSSSSVAPTMMSRPTLIAWAVRFTSTPTTTPDNYMYSTVLFRLTRSSPRGHMRTSTSAMRRVSATCSLAVLGPRGCRSPSSGGICSPSRALPTFLVFGTTHGYHMKQQT